MIVRPAIRHGLTTVSRSRQFHTSPLACVKVGDRLPDLADVLMEDSPENKINLAQELSNGKGLIIGVPAAFSKLLGRCYSVLLSITISWIVQLIYYQALHAQHLTFQAISHIQT